MRLTNKDKFERLLVQVNLLTTQFLSTFYTKLAYLYGDKMTWYEIEGTEVVEKKIVGLSFNYGFDIKPKYVSNILLSKLKNVRYLDKLVITTISTNGIVSYDYGGINSILSSKAFRNKEDANNELVVRVLNQKTAIANAVSDNFDFEGYKCLGYANAGGVFERKEYKACEDKKHVLLEIKKGSEHISYCSTCKIYYTTDTSD